MKIIYCIPDTYKPGGIERVVSIKANYFVEVEGYEVFIITSGQGSKKPFYQFSEKIIFFDLKIDYDEMLKENILKRILLRRKKRNLHKKKLSELLKRIKADIVISTLTHEADFLPNIKDGSKKILEFHFCKGHKKLMANSFNFSFLTKLAYFYRAWIEENRIIPKYDQFVVLTEEDKENWRANNVISIPNVLPFENVSKSNLTNRKIIAVGRLDAQKGFDRLIKIWRSIVDSCPGWILEIYGNGDDKETLENQINEFGISNTCSINAPVNNIINKYLESSIFVMTSRYEGMPMTMLEAMSVGVPCVSYNFKCGPRDIINDDIDGYVIKEGDEEAFGKKLISIVNNNSLRYQMGQNAKENITRYSINNVMIKWVELFKSITEKD